MEFIWYPKCSTCQKAYKHLKELGIDVTLRHIVEETPSVEELQTFIENYDQGIKPFFNTSGKVYKELGLKDKVKDMSVEEACELLASNGMLIKRPLLIAGNQVVVGYKKEQYVALKG